jgi:hypothetical protein
MPACKQGIDRRDFGAQADHELFAGRLGVLARFGRDRFHQGVELFVGGFVGDVVQVESSVLNHHQILRDAQRLQLASNSRQPIGHTQC